MQTCAHLFSTNDICFDKYGKIVLAMAGLVPSVFAGNNVSVIDILDMYSDDLPSPLHFNDEVIRWKRRWTVSEVSARPDTIAKALRKCDDETYPNLSVLLKIAGTVAVTSCECERSGSVLKRLNTYQLASVGQERMSGLAFIHISHDKNIDVTRVLQTFSKKPRALQFTIICSV